ncbi:hypothetical protein [Paraburkholderia acidisoli]|uniref:Uncharacterized protein n=1 Tax=Paraburkholderia acidisoli TaxID=2571748 RepID=A0A7Z2GQK8_9BURK|nr:hypothetical protein [Paraburkholderia acidisoli]QGZ66163.1 hypothetical protein FAZ98_30575 [Paraburkholderia acidisoli]
MHAADLDEERDNDPVLSGLINEIEIARKRLELAEIHSKLHALLRDSPVHRQVSEVEQAKVDNVQDLLAAAIEEEIKKLKIERPTRINVVQFTRNWVSEQWNTKLRYYNFSEVVPHEIVNDALKSLYESEFDFVESSEALFEVHRNLSSEPLPELKKYFLRTGSLVFRLPSKILYYLSLPLSRNTRIRQFRERVECRNQTSAMGSAANELAFFSPRKRAAEMRTERQHEYIQKIFSRLSVIFSASAAAFMFLMLLLGMCQLGAAILQGAGLGGAPHESIQGPGPAPANHSGETPEKADPQAPPGEIEHASARNAHEAMLTSLGALEIILVAPLPYLLILALNRYIKALAYKEETNVFRRELLEFKAFEVALFIAIIAASTVTQVLKEDKAIIKFEYAASVSLLIAVLSIYYFIVEYSSKETEVQQHRN